MRRHFPITAACLAVLAGAMTPAGHTVAGVKAAPALTRVVVATGFLPNVEFAPFYVAQDLGYYKAAGLDVTMNYDRVSNLMQAVENHQYTFATASGDAVAIGKAQGANVTYVMAQYQKYPVGAMWLKNGGPTIKSPNHLKGKTIGISAPGSSTDIGLRALQKAGHLTANDVKVTAIGFTETEALINKQIDVAMTYIDNEPVQARALGYPVNVMAVSKYLKLVSNGVVASTQMVKRNPATVQAFVTATLKGLRYTLQHLNKAFAISMKRQPEVTAAKDLAIQRQVLAARLKFQQPPKGHPLGWSSAAAWKTTITFCRQLGLIKANTSVKSVYTNIFSNTFAERAKL